MRLRNFVVVGLAGILSLAAQIADAQEITTPNVAVDGVSFSDTANADIFQDRVRLEFGPADTPRFANLSAAPWRGPDSSSSDRGYEVAVQARDISGFNLSASQTSRFGFDASGAVARESRSSELRLGRSLVSRRDAATQEPSWYMFVASEDEALIWRPGGQRNAFGGQSGGFSLQDRVEIGDLQVGVTYEAYGVQTSFAYVEREISVNLGRHSTSTDERFAGFTLTLRN